MKNSTMWMTIGIALVAIAGLAVVSVFEQANAAKAIVNKFPHGITCATIMGPDGVFYTSCVRIGSG